MGQEVPLSVCAVCFAEVTMLVGFIFYIQHAEVTNRPIVNNVLKFKVPNIL